jgi:hypothetical protein
MTSTDTFAPLDALRSAHSELLKAIPEDGPKGEADVERVRAFLRSTAQFGAMLDRPDDRKFAQGLLDYWVATLYGAIGDRRQEKAERLSSDETILAPFAEGRIKGIAGAAEEAVRSLLSQNGKLEGVMRQVVLRFVRFSDEGTSFVPVVRPRRDLLEGNQAGPVQQVLEALQKADALVIEGGPGEEKVRLKYEPLTRWWSRYAAWLEKRTLFRDAALFWEKHNRDPGALFTGALLEEARDYQDLNSLETEFVRACQAEAERLVAESARLVWIWRAIASVIAVLLIFVGILGYILYLKTSQLRDLEHAKKEALEARSIADSRGDMTLILLLQEYENDEEAIHVVKKFLVIQSLGSVAFADTPRATEAALENWLSLRKNLENSPWFPSNLLRKYQKAIDVIVSDSSPRSEKAARLLEISKFLREQIEEFSEDEHYLRSLAATRPYWFEQALAAALKLNEAARSGKRLDELSHDLNRFWRMYCCEFILLGGEQEVALARFRNILDEWEENGGGSAPRRIRVALDEAVQAAQEGRDPEAKP